MSADLLAVGLHQLRCQAHANPYASAVLGEICRLYRAAGEPEPACIVQYVAAPNQELADALADSEASPYAVAMSYQIIHESEKAP